MAINTQRAPAPIVDLLEREAPLAQLTEAVGRVSSLARGECALVHGEAGIGKTALVRAVAPRPRAARVEPLIAGCEALYTPRPLGPLVDLADRFAAPITAALRSGTGWAALFPQ